MRSHARTRRSGDAGVGSDRHRRRVRQEARPLPLHADGSLRTLAASLSASATTVSPSKAEKNGTAVRPHKASIRGQKPAGSSESPALLQLFSVMLAISPFRKGEHR